MAKIKTVYQCSKCGYEHLKWSGKCDSCNQWNTLEEVVKGNENDSVNRFQSLAKTTVKVEKLSKVDINNNVARVKTDLDEFDRVLGGGIVKGSVTLISGDPGVGKSTLLLQTLDSVAKKVHTLYVSGEESAQQIALRAERLSLNRDNLNVFAEINLEKILATLEIEKPDLIIIDSIQTLYSENLSSTPGSVSQVKECSSQLTRYAKHNGVSMIIVGHVTKDGNLAGPRVLEHIVDTVLYFEGETQSSLRIVRAFKNRFGTVNEIGVFKMTEDGLQEVSNPSALFINEYDKPVSGSSYLVTQEGNRPLILEVQALVDDSATPNARRVSVGLDYNRMSMLIAILQKHASVNCSDKNIFLNVVSGVKVSDTGSDLSTLLALFSSIRNKPLPDKMISFGEIGLAGEVRSVQFADERVKEAEKLGFKIALIPEGNRLKKEPKSIKVHYIKKISDIIAFLRKMEE